MLETKKYGLIEWIITITDEKIIDSLQSIQSKFEKSNDDEDVKYSFNSSSYSEIQVRKLDLDQLKREQNYQSSTSGELSEIAKEANIEESIDFLLADLKSMD